MQLYLNGSPLETTAKTLEEFMNDHNFTQTWLASAVNNNLVKKTHRNSYILKEGDKIEILSPMQGG